MKRESLNRYLKNINEETKDMIIRQFMLNPVATQVVVENCVEEFDKFFTIK